MLLEAISGTQKKDLPLDKEILTTWEDGMLMGTSCKEVQAMAFVLLNIAWTHPYLLAR